MVPINVFKIIQLNLNLFQNKCWLVCFGRSPLIDTAYEILVQQKELTKVRETCR